MKHVVASKHLWLLALLLPHLANAAPSLAESPFTVFATSPATVTFTTPQAVGNVIECGVVNTSGSVISGITAADSSNGSYGAAVATSSDSTNGRSYAHFWKVVTTAGTPTVTVTSGSNFLIVQCNAFTGFAGTPSIDSSMTQSWGPFAASTSFSFTPIATAHSNEILSMIADCGNYIAASPPSGWSNGGSADWPGAYKIAASSGTSATFAGTLNASSWISGLSVGIYDMVAGGAAYAVNQVIASQWVYVNSSQTLPAVSAGELLYECDATSGGVTLTLPTAVLNFNRYSIKKIDSSSNACTFATTSSQTIDGTTPTSITMQYGRQTVNSDNLNWLTY